MHDRDVRTAYRRSLKEVHEGELDTRIVEEMGLQQGSARIDMAVINGHINGFEIKSERDTLLRLPRQVELYNSTLDFVTVLAASKHVEGAMLLVPEWWGLTEVKVVNSIVVFEEIRQATYNPAVDCHALVQLLWRDEALEVLADLGLDRGVRSKPRRAIWKKLACELELNELKAVVRERLKLRKNWRVGVQLELCDG